ncbi:CPBP family intramembrane metalloprotease [Bifidobacterium asteroides]|uniref:CPBP family intramembrane glutamic endopeptidase n=1 Tax=Bifidobacterium asteroides TaxID=1684 RepID=UPI001C69EE1B|nr:type II CAAX endopeptidase family protein [Bifidobacterium asteroides]QYN60942.1 CPBP family intramembrane metalloprotease [Bifidobacterium asteroides]
MQLPNHSSSDSSATDSIKADAGRHGEPGASPGPARSWSAQVRRGVDLQSLYALVYLVVANLIAGVLNLPSVATTLGIARQPGLADLLGDLVMLVFLFGTRGQDLLGRGSNPVQYKARTNPGPAVLIGAILLIMLASSIETGFTWVVNQGSQALGLVYHSTTSQIAAGQHGFLSPLDTAILVPVVEEFLLRGVVMGRLRPYGRTFAIVTSSFIFACLHGDITQSLFTFLLGLVLGFIAMKYSIIWSMALHIFNNLVLADAMMWLTQKVPARTGMMINQGMVLLGLVGGLVVLWLIRGQLADRLRANRSRPGTYKGWISLGLAVLVVLAVVNAAQRFSLA